MASAFCVTCAPYQRSRVLLAKLILDLRLDGGKVQLVHITAQDLEALHLLGGLATLQRAHVDTDNAVLHVNKAVLARVLGKEVFDLSAASLVDGTHHLAQLGVLFALRLGQRTRKGTHRTAFLHVGNIFSRHRG